MYVYMIINFCRLVAIAITISSMQTYGIIRIDISSWYRLVLPWLGSQRWCSFNLLHDNNNSEILLSKSYQQQTYTQIWV